MPCNLSFSHNETTINYSHSNSFIYDAVFIHCITASFFCADFVSRNFNFCTENVQKRSFFFLLNRSRLCCIFELMGNYSRQKRKNYTNKIASLFISGNLCFIANKNESRKKECGALLTSVVVVDKAHLNFGSVSMVWASIVIYVKWAKKREENNLLDMQQKMNFAEMKSNQIRIISLGINFSFQSAYFDGMPKKNSRWFRHSAKQQKKQK